VNQSEANPPAPLLLLVYVSSASRLFADHELLKMLKKFKDNNARADITGMLVYKGGNFMQAIEGPPDAVRELFERIQRDPRHTGIYKLLEKQISEREFSKWSMGFQNVDILPADVLSGFSSFLGDGFTGESMRQNPGRAHKLLLMFKENMR